MPWDAFFQIQIFSKKEFRKYRKEKSEIQVTCLLYHPLLLSKQFSWSNEIYAKLWSGPRKQLSPLTKLTEGMTQKSWLFTSRHAAILLFKYKEKTHKRSLPFENGTNICVHKFPIITAASWEDCPHARWYDWYIQ